MCYIKRNNRKVIYIEHNIITCKDKEVKYQEKKSSIPRFKPEKVRGKLVLKRKKRLSFIATSSKKYEMGTVVQVCIFSIEKLKVEYDDSFYFTYFILFYFIIYFI